MKLDFTSDINKDYTVAMNYPAIDRFVVKVGWWMFLGLAVLTFLASVIKIANSYSSPFSWRVISWQEAIATLILGLFAALVPALLRGKFRNHYTWRVLTTFTLSIFAYLFVFVSGGAIEMHFFFFVMIALVVIYSDWRLGWIMLILVVLHHGFLNYTEPGWVYVYGRNDLSLITHAIPVLVQVFFTTILCINQRNSIRELSEAKIGLEKVVILRTAELQAALKAQGSDLEEVGRFNKVMVDRELKMVELKKEIEELKKK